MKPIFMVGDKFKIKYFHIFHVQNAMKKTFWIQENMKNNPMSNVIRQGSHDKAENTEKSFIIPHNRSHSNMQCV